MKYFVTCIVLMFLTSTILHGQVILQNQNHFGGSEWDGVADYFHKGMYSYVVSHTYSSDFDVEENAQPVSFFVFELDSALNLNSKLELVPSVGWSKDLVWVPYGNTCNDDACYFIIQDYALPTSFYLFRYDIPLNGNVSYIHLNDSWDNQIGRMQFLQVKDEFIEVWGRALDASTRIFRYDISDLSLVDSFTLTNTEFNHKTSWDYSVIANGDTSITLRSNWVQSPSPIIYELKYEKFVGKMAIDSKVLEPKRSISLTALKQFHNDYYVWGYVHHMDSTGTDYFNADAIILKYNSNFDKLSELVLSGSQFESIWDIEIDDSRIVFCGTSFSDDGDFYENDPGNKDFFIGLTDTTLKFIEMDYIGGADLEIGGKLDMSKNLSVCFQSNNSNSSEIVPVTYGDQDVYVSTVSFNKDCIDSYYIYDTSYVCSGDTVMFSGNYIHSDTTLLTSALGVYCDTLIETEFIVLDSLMVFIDSLYHSTGTDGYIGIHPNGGLSPYQYQWSNGLLDSNYINNLIPGTYTVTITDSNNCSKVMDIACDIATSFLSENRANRMHCRIEGRSIVVDDGVNYLNSNLNIYSSAGIPITTYRLDSQSISINIESYPSGIYFAEFVNFEGVHGYCKVYIP